VVQGHLTIDVTGAGTFSGAGSFNTTANDAVTANSSFATSTTLGLVTLKRGGVVKGYLGLSPTEAGAALLDSAGAVRIEANATGIDVTGSVTADGLTVKNPNVSGEQTILKIENAVNTGTIGKITFNQTDDRMGISNESSGSLSFDTATLERLNIASNGDISFYEDTGTTPKFVWDASAEALGIGTASPAALIHGMSGDLFLTANSTAADSGQGVFFQSTTSGWATSAAHAAIYGKRTDASNGYLRFDTRQSGTTQEAMRITSAGNVDLYQGNNLTWRFAAGSTIRGSISVDSADNITFSNTSSNTERLRIGADGSISTTTAGTANVRLGSGAGISLASGGNYNTLIGDDAGSNISTADNNTAVGHQAGLLVSSGTENTLLGGVSGDAITSGSRNTLVGFNAGGAMNADFNTFLGRSSGSAVTTGGKNTIIGSFNGNQNGLDIRINNNNIVLSDGDGNPRAIYQTYSTNDFWGFNLSDADVPAVYGYTAGYGVSIRDDGLLSAARSGGNVANFNRTTNDGAVVNITQNGTTEGDISVSGTTVSYNGGHLSRWSRLIDNSKDASIVKGTVMTNLDEMVEWGDEDNEQLNKMAVSSVEGDVNVAGVFVNWDEDDDWNDMNVAMTGDMIIRIAQGTTVARGDLLMSAGDGTAKPQGDDIVRSKTIAKVTSTHVSNTYEDGSFCVPCVVMAC
jgi:hypothetical protein